MTRARATQLDLIDLRRQIVNLQAQIDTLKRQAPIWNELYTSEFVGSADEDTSGYIRIRTSRDLTGWFGTGYPVRVLLRDKEYEAGSPEYDYGLVVGMTAWEIRVVGVEMDTSTELDDVIDKMWVGNPMMVQRPMFHYDGSYASTKGIGHQGSNAPQEIVWRGAPAVCVMLSALQKTGGSATDAPAINLNRNGNSTNIFKADLVMGDSSGEWLHTDSTDADPDQYKIEYDDEIDIDITENEANATDLVLIPTFILR